MLYEYYKKLVPAYFKDGKDGSFFLSEFWIRFSSEIQILVPFWVSFKILLVCFYATNTSKRKLIKKFMLQRRTISSSSCPVLKLIHKFLLQGRVNSSSRPVLELILKFMFQRRTSNSSYSVLDLTQKFKFQRRTSRSSCPVLDLIQKFMLQRRTNSSSCLVLNLIQILLLLLKKIR